MILSRLLVGVPFLAAALLPFIPARAGAWVGFGAALLAFALACRLAMVGGSDALGIVLALLATVVGATTAWFNVHSLTLEMATERIDRRQARAMNALFHATLGGALLATLADNLGVGWIGLEVGFVAVLAATALPSMRGAEAGWREFIVCAAALGLALFGIVVLTIAALPVLGSTSEPGWAAMSWSGLADAAPEMQPALLNLAFCFLLVGWGTLAALVPLQGWMPSVQAAGPLAISGVLSTLLLNAALANLLRLRGVMAACPEALAPGLALVVLGLASTVGGALLLWRRRHARRFLAVSTLGQEGLAAVAFGLGTQAAIFAGLLHLVLHTLAKTAMVHGVGRAALVRGGQEFRMLGGLWRTDRGLAALVLAAGLAVAGLPPAGVFASEFLVLAEAMRQSPVVAFTAGAGVVIAGWAVIARLHGLMLGPVVPDMALPERFTASHTALLGAWVSLALAMVLELAMPGPVLALLREAAR